MSSSGDSGPRLDREAAFECIKGDEDVTKRTISTIIALLLLWPVAVQASESFRLTHDRAVYADAEGGKLHRPEGVACRERTIVIADTGNGRLVRYEVNRGELEGGKEIIMPQVARPVQVHFNSRGEILVLDSQSRRIARLDQQGNPAGVVQPREVPDGSSLVIRAFGLDREDNLHLLDLLGNRVVVVSPGGTFQRQIPLPTKGSYSDVVVDSRGTVLVLDSVEAVIHAAARGERSFTPFTADLRRYVNFPASMALAGRGGLLVTDRNGAGIVMIGPDGSYRGRQLAMGWKPGLLYYPSQLCLTDNGELIIADRDNSRVQIFRMANQ